MTDDSVRDQLISSVAKYASNGKSNIPFGDWYNTGDGTANGFKARPVVGGHVALVSAISKYYMTFSHRDLMPLFSLSLPCES